MSSSKSSITEGSLSVNIIKFSIPVVLTGILQLLFNACDMVVVGRFASSTALAAVGATSSLANLIVALFTGLSVGVNVLAAQYFGARDHQNIQKTVHTSITLSLISGVLLAFVGFFVSRPSLVALNTPADVIDLSTVYMKIYFAGAPFMMVFNFGAAILRAQGNSRQPFMFLTVAGVINVILNLIFVIVFKMSVAGVALATLISNAIAAILIVIYLHDPASVYYLDFKKLNIDFGTFKEILRIGIPAGINSIVFAFANMQIQASVNIFGSAAVAGCAAATSLEGFIYIAMNSFYHSALNFTGQHFGAGKTEKIPKILLLCSLFAVITGIILGIIILFYGRELLSVFTSDSSAVDHGLIKLNIIAATYFMCGIMEVFVGVMRGLGYSYTPTIISFIGACGLRLLWIATVFKAHTSLFVLFLCMPVSWIITNTAYVILFIIAYRKIAKDKKKAGESLSPA